MSGYKVEICGVNTAKLPLLSSKEKEELFEKILKGDKDARERYIKGNLRLVLSVIQRFSGSQENLDDLFQIGCIGLIKAIDNFDITQNVKFSTYAVPMILGEVRRYLRDNNAIRVSRSCVILLTRRSVPGNSLQGFTQKSQRSWRSHRRSASPGKISPMP